MKNIRLAVPLAFIAACIALVSCTDGKIDERKANDICNFLLVDFYAFLAQDAPDTQIVIRHYDQDVEAETSTTLITDASCRIVEVQMNGETSSQIRLKYKGSQVSLEANGIKDLIGLSALPNGDIGLKGRFPDGKVLEGYFSIEKNLFHYELRNAKGSVEKVIEYKFDPRGRLDTIVEYRNGKPYSMHTAIYEDGSISEIVYPISQARYQYVKFLRDEDGRINRIELHENALDALDWYETIEYFPAGQY